MTNKRPNILFLIPDQHRGDWIPKIGHVKPNMPNVESMMDHGVTFPRAVTPSPLCAPARACLASGRRYENCGVRDNSENYPLDKQTFYNDLKDGGYSVGGVGKFDLHKPVHWWGLDGFIEDLRTLGFTHACDNAGKMDAINSGRYEPKDPYMKMLDDEGWREYHVEDMTDRGRKTHPTKLPDEFYCDNWLTDNGLKMLKAFPKDRPWFLQVNFTGPHGPFDVTERMQKNWLDVDFPHPIQCDEGHESIQKVHQNYAAMLENIDRNIGRLFAYLRETDQMDNTLIIYTSDHGDMLGDFNRWGKCQPQNGSVGIPMVISGPGVRENVVSPALVELQDLARTFTDYAGIADPKGLEESISMRPVLEGITEEHRTVSVSALNPIKLKNDQHVWQMAQNQDYKLILEKDGTARVYDVKADPQEIHPLDLPQVAQELRRELQA